MKISYNTLKQYIPNIKSVEEVAQDLVMHTAEVEEIIYEGENLKDVYIGKIVEVEKHPDSEKLNVCQVEVCGEKTQIVCGAANVKTGLIVPVCIVGAKLSEDFVIGKTKIRGVSSAGMIASEDELGLIEERQAGIMELPENAELGISMRDYLGKNDCYLDIDNKAINHRPDLFSHIGIIREIYAINGEKFDFEFENRDFSGLEKLDLENKITKSVKRYMGIKISGVENSETSDYIKEVIASAGIESKGLLIDITNYSLYFYGQPTHIFDADKVKGKITIRFANPDEKFLALDDKEYSLNSKDIVIADEEKVLALGGIIGGKESSVSETTKNIIIESANFDQAIIRKTGKTLGLRTDALNVFEKDLLPEMASRGASLIISELEKVFPNLKIEEFIDSYEIKQKKVEVDYDLDFINNLIGKEYSKETCDKILKNLGIKVCRDTLNVSEDKEKLEIPFWRKELNYKADIAEEIARIDGFDKIETNPPFINMGAVSQSNIYKIKNDSRSFFTSKGFFDIYNYSFVNEELMNKLEGNCKNLVPLKNALSAELTHMKGSLIPNLMKSLEDNIRERKDLKLFEIEKVFKLNGKNISENYEISKCNN
ncbi:MAG: phenylalanine--tRNA ligase subunit beta [Candidatus Gracilibacteria bacterium]|nr:phenylalanine--tRNA ligase subunit beta [Candidatus Gracilibacteria bacterium]